MPLLNISTTLPTSPVPLGSQATFTVRLQSPDHAIGAFVLKARIPDHLCEDLDLTPLAFGGSSNSGLIINGPLGEGGLRLAAGGGLNETAGTLDIMSISLRPTSMSGATIPFQFEIQEAFAQDGRPLYFNTLDTALPIAAEALSVDTDLNPGRMRLPYLAPLAARGGLAPYTWTLDSGTLPAGLTLDPEGFIQGEPEEAGSQSFYVNATDSSNPPQTAAANLTLQIQSAPLVIETEVLPPIAPDRNYNATLEYSGGHGNIQWSAENLPAGLSIENNRIEGMVTDIPNDYAPVSIDLIASDSSDPAQSARKSVFLPFVAFLPDTTVDTGSIRQIALGRDLVLVKYKVGLSSELIHPARDTELEREIEEARAAILDELIHAVACPPTEIGGGNPPFPEGNPADGQGGGFPPMGDATGDYGEPGMPLGEEPCLGVRFPGDDDGPTLTRGSDYVRALLGWYRELGSWTEGGSTPVSFDICVDVDGDEILCAANGFKTSIVMKRNERNAFSEATTQSNAFTAWLLTIVQHPARWLLRRRFENIAERLTPLASTPDDRIHVSNRETHDEGESEFRLPMDQDSFRSLKGALKQSKQRNSSKTHARIARWGSLAVLALAYIAGGPSVFFASAAFISAIAIIGTAIVTSKISSRWETIVTGLSPIDAIIKQKEKPDALTEISLTPGAHRITTRWERTTHGSTSYVAAGSSASMNFNLTFDPRNPENWPRLKGITNIAKGGIYTSGSEIHDVELTSSDLDLIAIEPNGTLKMYPAKGDGTFAAGETFANGLSNSQELQVHAIDDIGRSSVLALDTYDLRIFFNDGIRGFAERAVDLSDLPIEAVHSLNLGQYLNDTWRQIALGGKDNVVLLKSLESLLSDYQAPEMELVPVPFALTGEEVSSLASIDTESGASSIVATGRLGGQALSLSQSSPDSFDSSDYIEPLDEFSPTRQPVVSGIIQNGDAPILAIALRQAKRIEIFNYTDSSWEHQFSIELPFRPEKLQAAPGQSTAFIIATDIIGIALLVELLAGNGHRITPLHQSNSPLQLAHADGTAAISDSQSGPTQIYR